MQEPTVIRYDIIDTQSKKVVQEASSRSIANQVIARKNAKHGSYRYVVKAIWSDGK